MVIDVVGPGAGVGHLLTFTQWHAEYQLQTGPCRSSNPAATTHVHSAVIVFDDRLSLAY